MSLVFYTSVMKNVPKRLSVCSALAGLVLSSCTSPKAAAKPGKVMDLSAGPNKSIFSVKALPGRRYQLQKTESLVNAEWKDVGLPVTAVANRIQISDHSATNSSAFYRIIPLEK